VLAKEALWAGAVPPAADQHGDIATMNIFDKFCAAVAFLLGIVFLVLGVIGLFTGCKGEFTLPPLLGVIPAFVGWGIVRAVYFAWKSPPSPRPWTSVEQGIPDRGGDGYI
jgi:hypothetical protein